MTTGDLVNLVSVTGDRFQVHAWLLQNASRVFRDLLAATEEKEVQLTETNQQIKLLLNALYGPGCVLPEGLELEGEALTWNSVCILMEIADKFHAPRLLKSCTEFMTTKVKYLETAPRDEGLAVALEWLKLARRLELHTVTAAVASLLGRMFFEWNIKAHLKEISSEMDTASFLDVVSNISGGSQDTSGMKAIQSVSNTNAQRSSEDILQGEEQQQQAPVHSHFVGTAEPLLGFANHLHPQLAATAQALIPVGW